MRNKARVMGLLIIAMVTILVIQIACFREPRAALLCIPEVMLCIISRYILKEF